VAARKARREAKKAEWAAMTPEEKEAAKAERKAKREARRKEM